MEQLQNRIEQITRRLLAEDVTSTTFTSELARQKLEPCVGSSMLLKVLESNEPDIIAQMRYEETVSKWVESYRANVDQEDYQERLDALQDNVHGSNEIPERREALTRLIRSIRV